MRAGFRRRGMNRQHRRQKTHDQRQQKMTSVASGMNVRKSIMSTMLNEHWSKDDEDQLIKYHRIKTNSESASNARYARTVHRNTFKKDANKGASTHCSRLANLNVESAKS